MLLEPRRYKYVKDDKNIKGNKNLRTHYGAEIFVCKYMEIHKNNFSLCHW